MLPDFLYFTHEILLSPFTQSTPLPEQLREFSCDILLYLLKKLFMFHLGSLFRYAHPVVVVLVCKIFV